ncbi:nitrogen regulatory protein P-II family [Hydrogenispora ethanolica]|jgi:nitrogen regulatory protein P-II 1|uniref:Nitrogen regulatory protein P-II n=1 Tax=Hydrogenispora ethanolica TaxID=1082276 RepID=A0A4R1QZB1_HYDET|nr:P-II family nitrogen regulator [Hydrogenispora ethanolica]TCL58334.1 nitrogen regulatory protein P-II family [Hydrogenispora ethanolica]
MIKIEAIVRTSRFEAVKDALTQIGIQGITVSEVKGCGKQKGAVEHYRGSEYEIILHPKVKIEIVTVKDNMDKIIAAIEYGARTGEIGDGKIFVSEIIEAVQVRTGQRGVGVL